MSAPVDRFDEVRRRWIARHQHTFIFQKRRAEILARRIRDRAAQYTFEKQGLTVSDEEVLTGLMVVFPQFFKDGKLVAQDQLEQALQNQQGVTLTGGVEMMRQREGIKLHQGFGNHLVPVHQLLLEP